MRSSLQKALRLPINKSLILSAFLHILLFILLKLSFLDSFANFVAVAILHNHPQNSTTNEIAIELYTQNDNRESEFKSEPDSKEKDFLETQQNVQNVKKIKDTEPLITSSTIAESHKNKKKQISEIIQSGFSDLTENQNLDAKDPKSIYLAKIRNKIAQNQIYPKASLVFKEQGTVEIKLSLRKDGSVLKIELQKSSPFKRLNDAALQAVANSAPFESFPDSLNYKDWILLMPIRFKIE